MNYAYARKLAVAVVMSSINVGSATADTTPNCASIGYYSPILSCVKVGSDLTLHNMGEACQSGEGVEINRLNDPAYVRGLPKKFRYSEPITVSQYILKLQTYGQPDMMILPPDAPPKPGDLFRVNTDGNMERINAKWHLKDGKLYLGDTGVYIAMNTTYRNSNEILYGDSYTLYIPDGWKLGFNVLAEAKSYGELKAIEQAEFGK